MMRLSVIIPTLNEEGTIGQALQRALSAGTDEVVVVDGGSRDRTQDRAKAFPCQWMVSPPGRALQMNAGAKASKGEVLIFLHADTLLPPEAKSVIHQVLSDPQIVGGRFDIHLDRAGWLYRLVTGLVNLRSRMTQISTGDQAIFVRRAAFERMGGFARIPLMEDVEFSQRLKREGKIACLRNKVITSARRWETHGPLRTILVMWILRLLYFLGVSPGRLKRYYTDSR